MRFDGKSSSFVLVDLSKLDSPSAVAALADFASRTGSTALPGAVCHWIVSAARVRELLAAAGPGSEFLLRRLDSGDRLFVTNPTGLDWEHLFPSEADAEISSLNHVPRSCHLFLSDSGHPPYDPTAAARVFRATPKGLCLAEPGQKALVPWAQKTRGGVWWLTPGQALLGSLPAMPWGDLLTVPLRPARVSKIRALTPLMKRKSLEAAAQRTASPRLHTGLLFLSPDFPGLGTRDVVDFEQSLGGVRKRALVANMQGDTVFGEQGFQARFRGGRLVAIEDAQTAVRWAHGADSYLDWGGRRHRFQVNSAFSFEGDYSWGLRQSLVLDDDALSEQGRAILDYYFVEESREFFVAVTVRWPRWKAPAVIDRWAPLELSLFAVPWSSPLSTRCLWPDGRSVDHIHRGSAAGVLAGTDFVVSGGPSSLVLGFPQNQTPRPHRLPWRLVAGLGASRLLLSPEGGQEPTPSAEFEGLEEHFSFYLTPADRAKLPFSVTRKQAIELIPPYVLSQP